jgi:hypothetical protein
MSDDNVIKELGHYTLVDREPVKLETLKAWVEEVARRDSPALSMSTAHGKRKGSTETRRRLRPPLLFGRISPTL